MRFLRFFLYFFVIFMVSVGLVFAQEQKPAEQPPVEKKAEAPAITLGTLMYMNWHIGLTEGTDNGGGDKKNTFEFERIYLDLKYKLDEVWSVRITTDIENQQTLEGVDYNKDDETVGDSATVRSKYALFIKHGYLQAKKKLDPIDVQVRAGMIDTPISGHMDSLGDQRWIMENMMGMSKQMLFIGDKGYTLDTTADMGLQAQVDYNKLISAVAALTNGEGFKNSNESEAGARSEGKSYYGRLTVTPIEGLVLSGYYKKEGTDTDENKNQKGYYGASIAWVTDLVKVGATYLLPYEKKDGDKIADGDDEYEMSVLDIWCSLYLNSVIDIPVIVMARYGIADNGLDDGKTTFMGGGAGYVFNKYCRVIAWYQQMDNEDRDTKEKPNPEKQFAVKAEVKI